MRIQKICETLEEKCRRDLRFTIISISTVLIFDFFVNYSSAPGK